MAASTASIPRPVAARPRAAVQHVGPRPGRGLRAGVLLERTVHQAAAGGGLVARGRAAGADGRRRTHPLARALPRDAPAAGVPAPALAAHPRLRAHARARLPALLLLRDAADAGGRRTADPVPRAGACSSRSSGCARAGRRPRSCSWGSAVAIVGLVLVVDISGASFDLIGTLFALARRRVRVRVLRHLGARRRRPSAARPRRGRAARRGGDHGDAVPDRHHAVRARPPCRSCSRASRCRGSCRSCGSPPIATTLGYAFGVMAVPRIGSRVASFVGPVGGAVRPRIRLDLPGGGPRADPVRRRRADPGGRRAGAGRRAVHRASRAARRLCS